MSVNSCKRSINERSVIVPKYYNSGKRRCRILYTRLRTNCSALNNDLFLKRISDSPYCRCSAIEKCLSLLLKLSAVRPSTCRSHTHSLSKHITASLCVVLFVLFFSLFVGSTLSTQTNRIIFEAIHKYSRDSKRV